MSSFQQTIKPRDNFFNLRLGEIWQYRDLLILLVTRDFIAKFKQTLLGPAWFIVRPLLQTVTYTFIFGSVAKLPTDGVPKSLFYLAGITCWSYFSNCLTATSGTFTKNASLFGKVYFPRAVMPISLILSNLIQMGIQMILFLLFFFTYLIKGAHIQVKPELYLFPVLILIMGFMGLGLGMFISAVTTKYRDLSYLVTFGTQLVMYGTPVIYPLSLLEQKAEKWAWIVKYNPMSSIVETFRYSFLGSGEMRWKLLLYSGVFTVIIFLLGLLVFNRTEKNFMDTV